MIKRHFILISCAITALFACNDDNITLIIEENDAIDIGSYYLLETSIANLPYLDKSQVIFVDSLQNQITFTIDERELYFPDKPGHLFRYNVNEEGDTVRYSYKSEVKRFTIANDSLELNYDFTLAARPYYNDPESGYVADIINIFCRVPEQLPEIIASQVFSAIVDQRTYPISYNTDQFEHMEFIGRTFEDVYHNNFSDPVSDVYFNYTFGILSLTDHTGKQWRFERFN